MRKNMSENLKMPYINIITFFNNPDVSLLA